MTKIRLSPHFFLDEFTFSEQAARMGREIEVPEAFVENLRRLCLTILEPVRVDMGRPIFVSSGYRPDWLNKLVGGSPSSQHVLAEAADIKMTGRTPVQVCRRIVELKLPYHQLIYEFGRWTHVSISPTIPAKNQVLTARVGPDGKTQYLNGIVE